MKAVDLQVLSLLYEPINYAHISNLPKIDGVTICPSQEIINLWLLRRYKLADLSADWQADEVTSSVLLSNWLRIPNAAHLIGGYILKNKLPELGLKLMCDPGLLAFTSLPMIQPQIMDYNLDSAETSAYGIQFILEQFPQLPLAFRQRIMLLFPSDISRLDFSSPRTINHINLIKLAFTYANYYY